MMNGKYNNQMAYESGIDRIPEKSVICVEEDPGVAKETFILRIASDAALSGKKVTYLTPRMKEDVLLHMQTFRIRQSDNITITGAFKEISKISEIEPGDLCIIESFSLLFPTADIAELGYIIEWLVTESRKGPSFVLMIDNGVLPARDEQMIRTLSDGIIQFVSTMEGDRKRRYINIPKMRGMIPPDRMLPITIGDEGILIDTRERHG